MPADYTTLCNSLHIQTTCLHQAEVYSTVGTTALMTQNKPLQLNVHISRQPCWISFRAAALTLRVSLMN